MSTLAEIEAAADTLPEQEKEQLFPFPRRTAAGGEPRGTAAAAQFQPRADGGMDAR